MSILTQNIFSTPCLENMISIALNHARFNTSKKTFSAYCLTLERFQHFCAGQNLTLSEITKSDIQNFISTRRKEINLNTGEPYSFYSLNMDISILIKSFNLSVEKHLIPFNPASRFKKFKAVSKREAIESSDMKPFLKILRSRTKNINYFYAVVLALNSGMRKGEFCYLKWKKIDMYKKYAWIPNKKTGEQQKVYFNNVAFKIISYLYGLYYNYPYIWGPKPLNYRNINRTFNLWRDKCGLSKNITVHSTRHTAITAWAEKLPLNVAQDLARHASMEQTKKYIHVKEKRLHRAVQSISFKE